jgi:hypothetical protein
VKNSFLTGQAGMNITCILGQLGPAKEFVPGLKKMYFLKKNLNLLQCPGKTKPVNNEKVFKNF